jgi:hypothetical protein
MSAPFLFDTYDQADKFAASPEYLAWGDELKEKAGLVMLASNWYQGARHALTQLKAAQAEYDKIAWAGQVGMMPQALAFLTWCRGWAGG